MTPRWQQIIASLPYVCPKCSRRFPRPPFKGYCPNHMPATRIKVTDQTDLAAKFSNTNHTNQEQPQ